MKMLSRLKSWPISAALLTLLSYYSLSFSFADDPPKQIKTPTLTGTQLQSQKIPIIIDTVDRIKYASPISGFIETILFKEGANFKKSEVLVEYNCTAMKAEEAKARAAVTFLREKSHNMDKLFRIGGASKTDLAEIKSQLKASEEDLINKSYIVSHCKIKAPFDGQVVRLFASPFEYIDEGRPLLEIVNLNNLEVKLILPSDWLSFIKKDLLFSLKLNETGKDYQAKVVRLVYSIDAVSNTFAAYATLMNAPKEVRPGMSGTAVFEVDK